MITKKIKKGRVAENIFFPIFLGLIFLAVIGFLVFSNWKINQERAELQARIENLKKELQVLETKRAELEAGISQTEKESYWEEKIREQGYKKPGEEQVVVLPPEKGTEEQIKEEKNFWQKIFDWFKRD